MYVEQLYTGCLAEAAYYIESNGEAAIIDPLREYQPYLDLAKKRGAKIKYVLETHFHADFVSGHLDLSAKTGATIVFGPLAKPNYEAHVAVDGEELPLGKVRIKVLHTPGHTMESTTFLLIDEDGNAHSIFTGDTLFIGDVGRPDLAVKSDLTREDLAGHLFDSLREKIMPLPDEVLVYPGHGAGSACGKMMSTETWDTLGNQKEVNYALRADMTRDEFIKVVTEGLVAPPQYFPKNAVLNRTGYDSIDEAFAKGSVGLEPDEFERLVREEDVLVIDIRGVKDFPKGHIPGSLFIGIDDNFAPWLGALVEDLDQAILLVGDEDRIEEAITRAARVGYDNILGYLKGGMKKWKKAGKPVAKLETISSKKFAKLFMRQGRLLLLDVRKASEFDSEHILGAENFPLDFLKSNYEKLDPAQTYYLHCQGGYRSVIASSILMRRGFENLVNIEGGFKDLRQTKLERSEFVARTTML